MEDISLEEAERRWGSPVEGIAAIDAPAPRPRFKSLREFLSEYVPLAYAVEPIIRTGSLYTLTATTGSGKTAWMIVASLALATGRGDLIGREVERGRVAFMTFENPDDVRMRFMVAAFLLNVDVDQIDERIRILDARAKPEDIEVVMREESRRETFRLIFVDTLAAFFDGDDANSAVQAGEFMRRLRPFTRLLGLPAVVVAAHPIKAVTSEDQLIPYGSGAILNEVDGNLTLWRRQDGGTVRLHWRGKLRGLEFEAPEYRFEPSGSPDVLDAKGRQVQVVTMRPAGPEQAEQRAKADQDDSLKLLRAIEADPNATQRDLAAATGISKSGVGRLMIRFAADKLVTEVLGRQELTSKALKRLKAA